MNKRTLVDKLKALETSPSCYPDLKQAVKAYFVALAAEQVAAKNLVAELEDDVVDIDDLLKFAHSQQAVEKLGSERAKIFADNADALKAAGAKYCNCKACTIGLEILDNRDVLFDFSRGNFSLDKRTLVDKLKALEASPSCCPELKQAVKAYFVALAAEQVAAKKLIAELEDDVVDIDTLVKNVSDTEHMIKFFGVEGAKLFAENAYKLKASGAKYCNCKACTIGLEILDNRDVLLS